ncbi:MAG: hypothetical protein ACK4RK_11050 [Gemmataceae bacterium]
MRFVPNYQTYWNLTRGGVMAGLVLGVLSGTLLVSGAEKPRLSAPDAKTTTSPVPIQWVPLAPDQVAKRLAELHQGTLRQIPRAYFEDLVAQAAQAIAQRPIPPCLVESHYRAVLEDQALVGKSGVWKIVHTDPKPGLLGLQSMNLAIRQARWADSRDAVLGNLDGSGPALLVETPGEHTLNLEWSARGTQHPSGLHFELKVSPTAVATLELDLPADRVVIVSEEMALLTGPFPAEQAERRLWRVSFAGQSQLLLTIRQAGGPHRTNPLLLAQSHSRMDLSPGQVEVEVDIDLEIVQGFVDRLICRVDPTLRPYAVMIPNLEAWELQSGKGNTPATVLIRLSDPIHEGERQTLQIRCLGTLAANRLWTCPEIQVADAVQRGETIQLRVHPAIQLEDWQSGTFRFVETPAGANGSTSSSGTVPWQVIPLRAGLVPTTGARRPSALIKTPGPEFKVHQYTWWQIDPDGSTLTAMIAYELLQGRLFQLAVQLPANWQVEGVETTPKDLLVSWSVTRDGNKNVLIADLSHSLTPSADGWQRLHLRLRPTTPLEMTSGAAAIPDVIPLGARSREGALAITLPPLLRAVVQSSVPVSAPSAAQQWQADPAHPLRNPPWEDMLPDHLMLYHGQIVAGTVRLRPRPLRIASRCQSQIVLASGRASALIRLELQPEGGILQSVDFLTTIPVNGVWNWKTIRGTNRVVETQRLQTREAVGHLALLAAGTPLHAASLSGALPYQGSWWRLVLDRPLRERLDLEVTLDLGEPSTLTTPSALLTPLAGTMPLDAAVFTMASQLTPTPNGEERRWEVPLITVPGAERMEGEVTLYLAGTDLVQVDTTGLSAAEPGASWRTYRYGHPPLRLALRGRSPQADRSAETVADAAWLTVYVEPNGRLLHHFRFHVWNWRQGNLPVLLPAGATPVSARVDGRWTNELELVAALDGSDGPTVLFEVPTLLGTRRHSFELIYTTNQPLGTLWTHLQAPVPKLPVQTLSFRRTWRLPPDITPVTEMGLVRLPSGSRSTKRSLPMDPRALWSGWFGDTASVTADTTGQTRQQQLLAQALSALRQQRDNHDDWTLGQVLSQLALEYLENQVPLVVDVWSLQAEGIGPMTRLLLKDWTPPTLSPTRPPRGMVDSVPGPWDALQLVCVLTPSTPLLTTRRQLESWQHAGLTQENLFSIHQAVAEAAAKGHDRSGRFRTVLAWLPVGEEAGVALDGPMPPTNGSLVPDGFGVDWTEWEPVAGAEHPDLLWVVRHDALVALGIIWAGVLLLIADRFRRTANRWRWQLLLVWLVVGGLAMLWLPTSLQPLFWWPTLAGLLVALIRCLRHQRRSSSETVHRFKNEKPVVAGVLLLAGGAWGISSCRMFPAVVQAADAPPTTVYLTRDEHGDTVLAPTALIEQLETFIQQRRITTQDAVLVSGAYRGEVVGNTARLTARYKVYSFVERATLHLPLAGVQLESPLLDGAPTVVRALPKATEGYTLTIKGTGFHDLELPMSVPLPLAADGQELRCTIPDLPTSRLHLLLPADARNLLLPGCRGTHMTAHQNAGAQQPAGTLLTADLGRTSALSVRWWREERSSQPDDLQVEEAYLWQLHPTASRLVGLLRYESPQSTLMRLEVEIPPNLEVRNVEAVVSGVVADNSLTRLSQWEVLPLEGKQVLRLRFQRPVTSRLQVTLELVPNQPLGEDVVLPFPTPLKVSSSRRLLAYQVEDMEATIQVARAMIGVERSSMPETFEQLLGRPWRLARQKDLGVPENAFWGTRGGVPFLRLQLRQAPQRPRAEQIVSWKVGTKQADVMATARVHDLRGSLVEWEVPAAVNLIAVQGANVRYWSRTGSTVQVWLQRPASAATLELTGWLPRGAKDAQRFRLLPLPLRVARDPQTVVQVTAHPGLVIQPIQVTNLQAETDVPHPESDWTFQTSSPTYQGTFQVAPAPASAEAGLLTFAEVRDQTLTCVTTLVYPIPRGELRNLTLSLRNWAGGEVRLQANHVAQQWEFQRAGTRYWVLDLHPGVTDSYRLTLTVHLPLDSTYEVTMPDVQLEGINHEPVQVARWLAAAGSALEADAVQGLREVAEPAATLARWPGELARWRRVGGTVWQVMDTDWRLRLRPSLPGRAAPSVQVLLTEQTLTVIDGQRWLHEASYWLHHESGADLVVTLPANADVVSVIIDGSPTPPLQAEQDRLWLPLPGRAGARLLQLRWVFPEGSAPLSRPILEVPQLDSVTSGPVLWSVYVPTGFLARAESDAWSMESYPHQSIAAITDPKQDLFRANAAGQELRRAQAQLNLMAFLLAQVRDRRDFSSVSQLVATRNRFERYCRQAEYRLALEDAPVMDSGPQGQPLPQWLHELRQRWQELTRSSAVEELLAESKEWVSPSDEARAPASVTPDIQGFSMEPLPVQGTLQQWYSPTGSTVPRVSLMAQEERQTRENRTRSIILIGLVLVIWILAFFPRALVWPEQLALLGVLGLVLFGSGWGLLFGLLPVVWLTARLTRWRRKSRLGRVTPTAPIG